MLKHRSDQYRVTPNCIDIERFKPADREAAGCAGPGRRLFRSRRRCELHVAGELRDVFARSGEPGFKGVPVKLVLVGDELHGGLGGTEGYKRDMPALTSAKTAYFSEMAFDTTLRRPASRAHRTSSSSSWRACRPSSLMSRTMLASLLMAGRVMS